MGLVFGGGGCHVKQRVTEGHGTHLFSGDCPIGRFDLRGGGFGDTRSTNGRRRHGGLKIGTKVDGMRECHSDTG